jgi:hypothetical protein
MAVGPARSGRIPLLAALAILAGLGAVMIYLVRSHESRQTLKSFLHSMRGTAREQGTLPHRMYPTVDSLSQIGSGWIYLGPYDGKQRAYREGPYAEVAFCVAGGDTGPVVPHRGDVLRILSPSRVAIGNYRIEGLAHQETPPPKVHEILARLDLTGLRLAAGELVVARDVQAPWRFGKPRAVWCRVEACDPTSEPCAKALAKIEGERSSP